MKMEIFNIMVYIKVGHKFENKFIIMKMEILEWNLIGQNDDEQIENELIIIKMDKLKRKCIMIIE